MDGDRAKVSDTLKGNTKNRSKIIPQPFSLSTTAKRTWTEGAAAVRLQYKFHGAPLALAAAFVDALGKQGGHHFGIALVSDGGPQGVRSLQVTGVDVAERDESEN